MSKIRSYITKLMCFLIPTLYLSGGFVFGHDWRLWEYKSHPIFRYMMQIHRCRKCNKERVVTDPFKFI